MRATIGARGSVGAGQIFQLGEQLPAEVREAIGKPSLRLAAGVADSLPKLVVLHLMQPVLQAPNLRLTCHVDNSQTCSVIRRFTGLMRCLPTGG